MHRACGPRPRRAGGASYVCQRVRCVGSECGRRSGCALGVCARPMLSHCISRRSRLCRPARVRKTFSIIYSVHPSRPSTAGLRPASTSTASLSVATRHDSLGHVDNSETAAYVALLFRDQWSSWDTRITSAPHEMRSPRMTGERRAVCRCSRRQHRRESPVRFVHRQHVPVVVMVRVTVGTMLRGRRGVDHSGYSARRRATISSGTVVCAGPKVRIRRFWRLVLEDALLRIEYALELS